jgi:ribose 5-phosphate isomerase
VGDRYRDKDSERQRQTKRKRVCAYATSPNSSQQVCTKDAAVGKLSDVGRRALRLLGADEVAQRMTEADALLLVS